MKVLFDNNMPHPLRHLLVGHEVVTAKYRGWDRLRNSDLMQAAEVEFDAMITLDTGFATEQAVAKFDIAVLLLRAGSDQMRDLLPLFEQAAKLLTTCRPGRLFVIEPEEGEEPRSG